MESASKNAADLQNNMQRHETDITVNKFTDRFQKKTYKKEYKKDYVSHKPNIHVELKTANTCKCTRCGSFKHNPPNCPYKSAVCYNCSKVGHLAKVCRSGKQGKHQDSSNGHPGKVNQLEVPKVSEYGLFQVESTRLDPAPRPMQDYFLINGRQVSMEIDTGAAYSLISKENLDAIGDKGMEITPTELTLRTFTGQPVRVTGQVIVHVQYKNKNAKLPLIIVDDGGTNLCGRNWIEALRILEFNVQQLNQDNYSRVQAVIEEYSDIFEPTLGLVKGVKASITLRPDAKPRFLKARSVPFAFREKVEKELERLESEGIIEPVQVSQWASPIVPVLKSDGSVRICGDFKQTINKQTEVEQYPIPKIDEIFVKLTGGKKFTRLDLRDAYNQVELEKESQKYVVINTHKGLFKYTRMPFGISSAPAIFQRVSDTMMQGIAKSVVYFDDLLVTGEDDDDHLKNLKEVFRRLRSSGIKLKKIKCEFMLPSVVYLGYRVDAEGLHPDENKVKAIANAPSPRNVDQLRAFLGLLLYYAKFVPEASTVLAPLYNLLSPKQSWKWTEVEEESFQLAKSSISSSSVLVHYNEKEEVILACDASSYGVGAVLSHPSEQGQDRPIAFASRTLTAAEKNYSQLDKEALSLVFGVTRFRNYLLGRPFTLLTDHQPLTRLFAEDKTIPNMASARIQRWALTLGAYDYRIQYRKGSNHGNADCLSRLPMLEDCGEPPLPEELVLLLAHLERGPVTDVKIRTSSSKDPVLNQVLVAVRGGSWPSIVTDELKPFLQRKLELSVQNELLLWGSRVVVPKELQPEILQELHEGHQGISKMKSLARGIVWWPGLDQEIERKVKSCVACQQVSSMPPINTPSPWPKPKEPWSRVHIDYAGPVENRWLLIVIDSFTKWIEVCEVKSPTSEMTVQELRLIFARLGLPHTIVSDNGTQFTSWEFQEFVKENGIVHLTTAPYHPSSNGLAERAVRIIKTGLKKIKEGSFLTRLARILINYRITPLNNTNDSPAKRLFGRQIRNRLDLIKPKEVYEESKEEPQEAFAPSRTFKKGDKVFARNFGQGPKWTPGTISEIDGKLMYQVSVGNGVYRRHIDQLKSRLETGVEPVGRSYDYFWHQPKKVVLEEIQIPPMPELVPNVEQIPIARKSSRVRKLPVRYM